jgi:hypothetical protein
MKVITLERCNCAQHHLCLVPGSLQIVGRVNDSYHPISLLSMRVHKLTSWWGIVAPEKFSGPQPIKSPLLMVLGAAFPAWDYPATCHPRLIILEKFLGHSIHLLCKTYAQSMSVLDGVLAPIVCDFHDLLLIDKMAKY